MKKPNRGLTVPEILVTTVLLVILTQLIVMSLVVLSRSKTALMVRTEPRQQLRSFVLLLQAQLREAGFLFQGETYPVWNANVEVPEAGSEGNGLVFAVPESATAPMSYGVCYTFSRPRLELDIRNPDAYEAVFYTISEVTPPAGIPAALDPAAPSEVGNVAGLRVFDTYLDGPEGLKTEMIAGGQGIKFKLN
ncbi:MAG: hypothetical protein WC314_17155 [Vulcanimicrobiota bacterium]